ncbi:9295_t:CDS:1, partial [Cetraspora pellucida]
VKHQINTGNVMPAKQHSYYLSPKHQDFIKEKIEHLLKQGLIKPSYSSWASPALVIDYQQLNK